MKFVGNLIKIVKNPLKNRFCFDKIKINLKDKWQIAHFPCFPKGVKEQDEH